MTLSVVQSGSGAARLVVIAYFVADFDALKRSLPSSACVLVDNDGAAGRFARAPGASGINTIDGAIGFARMTAGDFEPSGLVLIGWSKGCQAPREQLRAGARPDVVLALDGTSGEVPPTPANLDPWRDMAARARRGEALLIITATQQVYTRDLPAAERFEATLYVVTELWTGTRPTSPADLLAPGEYRDGGFVVIVHPSARLDGDAHKREQNVHLPEILARLVMPWIQGRTMPTDTPPVTARTIPPPVLRKGDSGAGVRVLQAALNDRGAAPPLAMDGDFGPRTLSAVLAFQRSKGLDRDGIAGPLTMSALGIGEAPPSVPGPPPFPALSETEKDAIFGRIQWKSVPTVDDPGAVRLLDDYAARELGSVVVSQLIGVRGAPASGRVTMHRLAAPAIVELFQRWEDAGLLPLVRSWAGSVAFRLVRGGVTLSSHARGISFDVNADYNGLGRVPLAVGALGSTRELVPIARELGWFWGGDFSRPDGMHFERARA